MNITGLMRRLSLIGINAIWQLSLGCLLMRTIASFQRYIGYLNFINGTISRVLLGPLGVLGIWGEWLFIFRKLRSTGKYFRGAREQAHNFGNIGSLAKKPKNKKIRKSLHFV